MPRLGRYRIECELDERGLGVSYRGTDPYTGAAVAIKTIRVADYYAAENAATFRGRLRGDVRAAASVLHPNIAAVYEAGQDGELDWVAVEYVGGRALREILAVARPDIAEGLRILTAVAEGLDCAHGHGLVHDHLGADCILIRDDGDVKVAGLGTGRMIYVDVAALGPYPQRLLMMIPECPSPEFIKYEMPRTGRSDQFSLGAVAYELVTGRRAFAGENLRSLLAKIVEEDAAPYLANPGLEAVLKKAMAKDAVERFESCGEFVRALRDAA